MAGELLLLAGALSAGAGMYVSFPRRRAVPSLELRSLSSDLLMRRLCDLLEHAGDMPLLSWWASRPWLAPIIEDVRGRMQARIGVTPSAASVLAGFAAAGIGLSLAGAWWSASPAGAVVGLLGGAAALALHAHRAEQRRARALVEEMPGLFRSLASSLAAGRSLVQSIDHVAAHEEGPAAFAFKNAALRLRCAIPISDVLRELKGELEAPGVDLLVSALAISQRNGSPLNGILEQAAELVERQGEFEQMLKVKTAQVRLSSHIVCALPIALAALLLLISPDYQAGIATPLGVGCVVLALALDAAALIAMRIMMKGVI